MRDSVLHLMLSLHMEFGCLSLHVTTYCNQIICVSKHLRSPVDRKERPIKLETNSKQSKSSELKSCTSRSKLNRLTRNDSFVFGDPITRIAVFHLASTFVSHGFSVITCVLFAKISFFGTQSFAHKLGFKPSGFLLVNASRFM